jgi:hypothetical protein
MTYSPKIYMGRIAKVQEILLGISLCLLAALPILLLYFPDTIYQHASVLYFLSLFSVTLVMSIRPLADLFPNVAWLRPLVILRKGAGVFSASIIVSFLLSKILLGGGDYFAQYLTRAFWSMQDYALLAHLGDVTAVILLVTSNIFSKRVLGKNWKRIQKLAYVYFYTGALYEFLALKSWFALIALSILTGLVVEAHIRNKQRKTL